ncbi:MAG TPA: glycosyltransferase family A protein [Vitreimonas sp.]|uniref:glycosyltransferase family A protein n=1 Tax=Vitreimonas sp. TaxID=3069702 RepID=UPI002D5C33C4|nr:glycosyltransferase family A protein [Vitreimonas sp.]HYD89130.1 glycosyltransferase family A protein [Vitreimonas sp.]
MRVAAAMVVRNERPYLGNCLRHLIDNGIDFYIIDNASTDETRALLAADPFRRALIGVETYPFDGAFDWKGLVQVRERAAGRLDADWVLFVSADEMMHSYRAGERLCDAIARIGREGWDAIDFNEFVFLPIERDYAPDAQGFPDLRHYYFFEPHKPRLMRARRADLPVSHVEAAGHFFAGEFKLAPETFALRHYIVRNQDHAYRKYQERVFKADELSAGWHANRHQQERTAFAFPDTRLLHRLGHPADRALDRARPHDKHYWQW